MAKVLGVESRDLVLAYLLGRLTRRRAGAIGWIVMGSNLGLGVAALYWISRKRLPAPVPRVSPRLRVTFAPERIERLITDPHAKR